MATSLADRIRQKARESANLAPTGATQAIAKQAQVSSTGKAAPTQGAAQSNITETAAAQATESALGAVQQGLQEQGEAMAAQEQQADLQQQAFESRQRMQKAQADQQFSQKLAGFTQAIEQAASKKDQDLAIMDLENQLQSRRLTDQRYKDELERVGRTERLQSKEDFANKMAETAMARGKQTAKEQDDMNRWVADYKRDSTRQVQMSEIQAALEKSKADSRAMEQAAKTQAVVTGAKAGISYGAEAYADRQAQNADWEKVGSGQMSHDAFDTKHGAGAFESATERNI